MGRIEAGARADLLVLDPESPTLWGKAGDLLLDAMIFAGNVNPVRDVMVGGRWLIREGRHEREAEIWQAYRRSVADLAAAE